MEEEPNIKYVRGAKINIPPPTIEVIVKKIASFNVSTLSPTNLDIKI